MKGGANIINLHESTRNMHTAVSATYCLLHLRGLTASKLPGRKIFCAQTDRQTGTTNCLIPLVHMHAG